MPESMRLPERSRLRAGVELDETPGSQVPDGQQVLPR